MTMKTREGKAPYDKSLRPVRQPGQLGDWAAVLAVALFIGLWTLWPSAPPRTGEDVQIPDPSCAYGTLSRSSSAGNVLARFKDGPAGDDSDNVFARLPAAAPPAIPAALTTPPAVIPPPAYAAKGIPPAVELPPAPAFPFKRSIPVQTGLVVQVSESLKKAGFAFDPPPTSNAAPFSLSADIVFNGHGLVESVLINGVDSAYAGKDIARWESALLLSHAVSNATGTISISLR